MDSFYWIILSVATLVLIATLGYMGYLMTQVKKGTKYPMITTSCPDNWILTDTSGCTVPTDGKYNIPSAGYETSGNTPGLSGDNLYINFADAGWGAKEDSTCAKKTWAAKYNVKWDSVENANYC